LTCEWVTSHRQRVPWRIRKLFSVRRDSFTCVDMTPSYVWYDIVICATWPIHMCWHDSITYVIWTMHMCNMTRALPPRAFGCVFWGTWLVHVCCCDSFICADVTHWNVLLWLNHMCDMMYSYVWHASSQLWRAFIQWHMGHDSFICVTWLDYTIICAIFVPRQLNLVHRFNFCAHNWVTSHIWMSHVQIIQAILCVTFVHW